jgi:hypothetical protein
MLVSILIPTLFERMDIFQPKLKSLYKQIKNNNLEDKVEVIVISDNRTLKLSEKRNTLQKLSRGKYFTHLDDDDNFTGYDQKCFVKDKVFVVKPSLNFGFRLEEAPRNVPHPYDVPVYFRTPWQWCLWNTERFQHVWRTDSDTNAREDQNWLKRVHLDYPKSMSVIENWIGHEYHFEDPSIHIVLPLL